MVVGGRYSFDLVGPSSLAFPPPPCWVTCGGIGRPSTSTPTTRGRGPSPRPLGETSAQGRAWAGNGVGGKTPKNGPGKPRPGASEREASLGWRFVLCRSPAFLFYEATETGRRPSPKRWPAPTRLELARLKGKERWKGIRGPHRGGVAPPWPLVGHSSHIQHGWLTTHHVVAHQLRKSPFFHSLSRVHAKKNGRPTPHSSLPLLCGFMLGQGLVSRSTHTTHHTHTQGHTAQVYLSLPQRHEHLRGGGDRGHGL